MATIEYITKRIQSTNERITKLEAKLNRINTALNGGANPYSYSDYDLRITTSDLAEARKSLDKYQAQLIEAQDKAASRNVPAITEFLNAWKARMTEFYMNGLREYYEELSNARKLGELVYTEKYGTPEYESAKAAFNTAVEELKTRKYGTFKKVTYTDRWGKTRTKEEKVADGYYEQFFPYYHESTLADAEAKLNRDLQAEWERKYDFILDRTCAIVGQITDASHLTIGAKGDLNGYIVGTKGVAKVQTVGAGGYNIQCFHFRTLINPMPLPKYPHDPKPQTTTSTQDFKGMSIEQLKDLLAQLGGECKVYDNEAIYRMRLIMAIKKLH